MQQQRVLRVKLESAEIDDVTIFLGEYPASRFHYEVQGQNKETSTGHESTSCFQASSVCHRYNCNVDDFGKHFKKKLMRLNQ